MQRHELAVFSFGPFLLDPERRLLARDGAPIAITPKAFDLLVVLVARRGAVVSKDELMAALWPDTAV
ncbi:MAG TPA: winged helix-turn-helix domain-containing protein, partial [Thermoanaerobaculia bacterium]|nr:winged helix-turn-helix domain-containing protein [Thermoanaerobaculia bacterium]